MTATATDELIFDILKRIQSDVSTINLTVAETSRLLGLMRDYELRLESMYAGTLIRLERIERRFGFG